MGDAPRHMHIWHVYVLGTPVKQTHRQSVLGYVCISSIPTLHHNGYIWHTRHAHLAYACLLCLVFWAPGTPAKVKQQHRQIGIKICILPILHHMAYAYLACMCVPGYVLGIPVGLKQKHTCIYICRQIGIGQDLVPLPLTTKIH